MIDLNRNFPSQFPGSVPNEIESKEQSETSAIISWSKLYPFVLSANFHSGAVVVNYYPYIIYMKIYLPSSSVFIAS